MVIFGKGIINLNKTSELDIIIFFPESPMFASWTLEFYSLLMVFATSAIHFTPLVSQAETSQVVCLSFPGIRVRFSGFNFTVLKALPLKQRKGKERDVIQNWKEWECQRDENPAQNHAEGDKHKISFTRGANTALYPPLDITLLGIITIDYHVICMAYAVL